MMNSVASRLSRKQLSWGSRSVTSFVKFHEHLSTRRQQADKSLLIQVSNSHAAEELKTYLTSHFGPLEAVFHYTIPRKVKVSAPTSPISSTGPGGGIDSHWLLAEFTSHHSAQECISSCGTKAGTVPFNSAMCWFKNEPSKKAKTSSQSSDVPDIVFDSLTHQSLPDFKKERTLSEQLFILEESTKLSELGIRVRFLVASQLENIFANLFPRGCVLPFGSTVSGIGRQSGDLDLVLLPDSGEIFPREESPGNKSKQRLFYQSKLSVIANSSNARFQSQRVMETMADVLQLFLPGCTHVQRILQARVPILRFWSDFTDLQCDLSMTNSSGVHMSELIYLMSKLEPRFSTLLFAIRSWASSRKITNPIPGRQPTNFMFVLLLIYFLQQRKLLPTLDILFNNAGRRNQRLTTDGIDCSFLRDKEEILKYFSPQSNQESVAELLFDFFEFYSEFDFHGKGISLITGTSWGKPEAGPLYIQNPLERHLNVARNVSKEEVSRFKSECCSALWKLETLWSSENHSRDSVHCSIQDLLLTPVHDQQPNVKRASHEARLQIKELFIKD